MPRLRSYAEALNRRRIQPQCDSLRLATPVANVSHGTSLSQVSQSLSHQRGLASGRCVPPGFWLILLILHTAMVWNTEILTRRSRGISTKLTLDNRSTLGYDSD